VNSAPFKDPEHAFREALAITDAEDRDAALYDLAFELRKRSLHDEALHVLTHIADSYVPIESRLRPRSPSTSRASARLNVLMQRFSVWSH
jgi:hypothetical protein